MNAVVIFLFTTLSSFYLILASIAFYRTKDIFAMTKSMMMTNFYIFPLTIIALEIQEFEMSSLIKILVLILLNIVLSSLICHLIVKRALANNIQPDEKE